MTTNQYGEYMTMDDLRRSGQSSINDNQQNSSSGKKIVFNIVLILVLFAIGGAIYYFGFYKRENIVELSPDSNGNPVDSNSYQQDSEFEDSNLYQEPTASSENEDDNTDIPVPSASSNQYVNEVDQNDPTPTSSTNTNFLGMDSFEAKEIIMKNYDDVITEVVIIPMGSIVTGDYREDRVRLYVDDNDKVVKVEAPGIPSIEGESQVSVTDEIVPETIDYPTSSNSSKTYTVEESQSDNEAEQLLINILNTKMSHEGYRCYTKREIPGSLSGPKELAHTDSCNKSCSCKGLTCGARNNVKTQVLALLSENQITQYQADRFITNLRLDDHPKCV